MKYTQSINYIIAFGYLLRSKFNDDDDRFLCKFMGLSYVLHKRERIIL